MDDEGEQSTVRARHAEHAIPQGDAPTAAGQSRQLLWWVLAGAAAGAIARISHPYTLVLTGLMFGIGQWLALRRALRQTSWLADALWVPASALGGLVAYLVIASYGVRKLGPLIIAMAAPYEDLASHIIFVTMLWTTIGLAQWPILRRQLSGAGWWVPASAAGGALAALVDIAIELAGGAMHGSLPAGVLSGAAYGICTGGILRGLTGKVTMRIEDRG